MKIKLYVEKVKPMTGLQQALFGLELAASYYRRTGHDADHVRQAMDRVLLQMGKGGR